MKKVKKFTKAALSIILAFVMLEGSVFYAIAAPSEESGSTVVTPRWTSIASIELGMTFSDGIGNASGLANKKPTSSLIEVTLTVYKWKSGKWQYVASRSGSETVGTVGISVDFVAEPSVRYKAVFEVTAYTNNVPETMTVEREDVYFILQ